MNKFIALALLAVCLFASANARRIDKLKQRKQTLEEERRAEIRSRAGFDGFEHQETAHVPSYGTPGYFAKGKADIKSKKPLSITLPSGATWTTDDQVLPISGGNKVSFSELTSMGGDYFGSKSAISSIICSAAFTLEGYISNTKPRPATSIGTRYTNAFNDLFNNNYYTKPADFAEVLKQIRQIHGAEEDAIIAQEKTDPKSALSTEGYKRVPIDSSAVVKWALAPRWAAWKASMSGYQEMVMNLPMNDDHFSTCAKETYNYGHNKALELAAQAGALKKAGKLKEADAKMIEALTHEGFVSHFYTDLFSAGHTRGERSLLRPFCVANLETMPAAGLTSNLQHDEDGVNCLLVTNKLKKLWWACGDERFFDPISWVNRKMVRSGLEAGLNDLAAAVDGKRAALSPQSWLPSVDFSQFGDWAERLRLENTCPRFIFRKNKGKYEMATRRNTPLSGGRWSPRPEVAILNNYGESKAKALGITEPWDSDEKTLIRIFGSKTPAKPGKMACDYWPWMPEGRNDYCCGVTGGRAVPKLAKAGAETFDTFSSTCTSSKMGDAGFDPEHTLKPTEKPVFFQETRDYYEL